MSRDTILFEKALSEPYQLFLSAETLLLKIQCFLNDPNPELADLSFSAFIELLHLLEQSPLISHAVNSLDRHQALLNRLLKTPAVDLKTLSSALDQIQESLHHIKHFNKERNLTLKNHNFLNRARFHWQQGSLSDFNAYQVWRHQPTSTQQAMLSAWLNCLKTYSHALQLVLNLTRESAYPTQEVAQKGKFHTTLEQPGCQLLRLKMAQQGTYYPEVNFVNKTLRIQFYQLDFEHGKKPVSAEKSIDFELTQCFF